MSEGVIIALVIGGLILFIIFCIVCWYISAANKLHRYVTKIDESESSIDVALTKRFDLLTKLVSAVKGYQKHESETFAKIVELRQPAKGATMAQKQEFANDITAGLKAINVVVESYPQLKADTQFSKLQDATVEVEENLQAARRNYNGNVSIYNQFIGIFPSSIVANRKGYTKRDFFEAESAKREDVKFDF